MLVGGNAEQQLNGHGCLGMGTQDRALVLDVLYVPGVQNPLGVLAWAGLSF